MKIDRGSAYTVGRVTVAWRSAETELAAADALAAAHVTEEKIVDTVDQRLCPLFFCGRGRFSYDELQEDRDTLRELFQKAGYPAVRVRIPYDPRVYVDRATKTVTLAIEVNLGKRLTVSFQGVENKSEQSLRDALTFNAANATDDYEAEASAEAIRDAYQGDGRFQTVVSFDRTRIQPERRLPELPARTTRSSSTSTRGRSSASAPSASSATARCPSATLRRRDPDARLPDPAFLQGRLRHQRPARPGPGAPAPVLPVARLPRRARRRRSRQRPDARRRPGRDLGRRWPPTTPAAACTSASTSTRARRRSSRASASPATTSSRRPSSPRRPSSTPGRPVHPRRIAAAACSASRTRYDALAATATSRSTSEIAGDGRPPARHPHGHRGRCASAPAQVLVRGNFKTARWVVRDNFELDDRRPASATDGAREAAARNLRDDRPLHDGAHRRLPAARPARPRPGQPDPRGRRALRPLRRSRRRRRRARRTTASSAA